MTLTVEQMRQHMEERQKRYAELAAKARRDFEREVASMERARLLSEQTKAEQARRDSLHPLWITRLERKAVHDARIASGLHLLDLKRAGHSPTRTELRMVVDGQHKPVSIPIPPDRSIYGSSSQMCAEITGDRGRMRYGVRA